MTCGAEYTVLCQLAWLACLHIYGQVFEIALQQGVLLFGQWRVTVETVTGIVLLIINDLTDQAGRESMSMPAAGPF